MSEPTAPQSSVPARTDRGTRRAARIKFSETVADQICGRMAEGETLRQVCRDQAMPARSTVYRWLSENAGFASQYARAREHLVEAWADEIIDIADDGTTDYVEKVGRNGAEYMAVDQEHIQRSRLRVDARRWLLSKLNPGQYGDHMEVDVSGQVDHRVQLTTDERVRRLALFLLQAPAAGTSLIEGQASPLQDSEGADLIQPEPEASQPDG